MHCLDALGAGLHSFAGCQFNPLEIGVFSYFGRRIEFAAELNEPSGHLRALAAD